jgi:uncharacterized protein YgbK (DUF1537 family)
LGSCATLLAPAFPAAGRIVRNGVLKIQSAAGDAKEIPLASLFPIIGRNRLGAVSNPSELGTMLDSGKTVLICDSETQADLEALVRAAQQFPRLLYAGSAGLARALAGLNLVKQPPALVPPAEQTLIIAGSPHPATRLQLDTLEPDRFAGNRVLRIGFTFGARSRIRSAFRTHAPQAIVLTGGETALLAVRALEAHSFILQGELAPGVPWGLMQGGLAHGCVVVTKSGGFGAPTIFNDILTALRGSA